MTEDELKKMNESLYEDAKIYWIPNMSYSSKVFERVMSRKNTVLKKSGSVNFITENNLTIASGVGRIDLLIRLSEMMR